MERGELLTNFRLRGCLREIVARGVLLPTTSKLVAFCDRKLGRTTSKQHFSLSTLAVIADSTPLFNLWDYASLFLRQPLTSDHVMT